MARAIAFPGRVHFPAHRGTAVEPFRRGGRSLPEPGHRGRGECLHVPRERQDDHQRRHEEDNGDHESHEKGREGATSLHPNEEDAKSRPARKGQDHGPKQRREKGLQHKKAADHDEDERGENRDLIRVRDFAQVG